MAMQTTGPSNAPSPQIIGNAFVEQYYHFLHNFPEQAHKFYQESSMLSRPGDDGEMTSVTTMEGISDKILSLNLKDYQVEILTADAQDSLKEGVIVLVTGCLSGTDSIKRKFTQTFFLARQDKGYYVLNDLFRFVDGDKPVQIASLAVSDVNENVPAASVTPDPEPVHAPDHSKQNHTSTSAKEVSNNGRDVSDLSDTKGSIPVIEKGPGVEEVAAVEEVAVAEVPVTASQNGTHSVAELASNVKEGVPKMSYASIVAKENPVTSPVHVPTKTAARDAPLSTEPNSRASPVSKFTAPRSTSASRSNNNSAPRSNNDHVEVKGIYVGNLPADVTVKQLEEVFKTFGPITRDGIQIRRFQEDGFCYGFVEFESLNSAHSAVETRNITIGNKEAYIEEKKTVNRVGNGGRGRLPSGRGGFANDNFRGRENFGGGRGYGRYEYGNRGEFSGQAGGPSGRNGEASQRGLQNGGGRFGRQGGMK